MNLQLLFFKESGYCPITLIIDWLVNLLLRIRKVKVDIREVAGPWKKGYVLDRHVISSTPIGHSPNGYIKFDTKYTDTGRAINKLKYRNDATQVNPLVDSFIAHLAPLFPSVSLITIMPPSRVRATQPMTLLAQGIAEKWKKPYFNNILVKISQTGLMKDLKFKAEKLSALTPAIGFHDQISTEGCWDALILDDLFDSGASLEVATNMLSTYHKVNDIYVAAFTKTGK